MNVLKSVLLVFSWIFFFYSPLFSYEDSKEKRLNLWPLAVYNKNKVKGYERIELLGPFIARYSFEKENSTYIRPFYTYVETPQEKKAFFLSPLGLYRSDNETATFKIIPLISQKIEKQPSEEKEGAKWEYFPIFYGKTSDNKTYGGVFPLYGKFKDRFGKEEITFFLWPLYSKVTYEYYIAHNVLWPFIRVTQAKKKEDEINYKGFKIWPIYGHFSEGEEERKFVFWPFYIRNTFRDDMGNFEEKLLIFPFYGKEKTETYEKTIYLWPFYQRICAQDPYYEQVDAPWPFYRHIKGEKIHGKRYWPLYGYLQREDSYDYFFLWPFYFYKEDHFSKGNYSYKSKEHRFLLLSKKREVFEEKNLTQSEFRLWPLYYNAYTTEDKNVLKIEYFPALLPLHDEGMDRNYGPILKLFENIEREDYKYTKVLWGLFRYEREGKREVQELAFIFRRVKDEDTDYVEFFEGLLGIGKVEKRPVIKIFFLNILHFKEVTNVP